VPVEKSLRNTSENRKGRSREEDKKKLLKKKERGEGGLTGMKNKKKSRRKRRLVWKKNLDVGDQVEKVASACKSPIVINIREKRLVKKKKRGELKGRGSEMQRGRHSKRKAQAVERNKIPLMKRGEEASERGKKKSWRGVAEGRRFGASRKKKECSGPRLQTHGGAATKTGEVFKGKNKWCERVATEMAGFREQEKKGARHW